MGVMLSSLLLFTCEGMQKRIYAPQSEEQPIVKDNVHQQLITILTDIDNNSNNFLAVFSPTLNGFCAKFKEYKALNKQRMHDLEQEAYNPLTLPTLIALNTFLLDEYSRLTDNNDNRYSHNQREYLKALQELKNQIIK